MHVQSFKNLLAASSKMVDPRLDPDARALYKINEGNSDFDRRVLVSAMVSNVVRGNTGPGAITILGCDYHNGTSETGDRKDYEIGQEIGRAIEIAHRLGKPLFIQILTDGGISSKQGTRIWAGDDGTKSMTVIGYHSPKGPPEYEVKYSVQLGSYLDDQKVNLNTIVGGAPVLAAYAVFSNYLHATGQIDKFKIYAPLAFPGENLKKTWLFKEPSQANEF
jgi:hypothetical protein